MTNRKMVRRVGERLLAVLNHPTHGRVSVIDFEA